jgi:hypothetical protein
VKLISVLSLGHWLAEGFFLQKTKELVILSSKFYTFTDMEIDIMLIVIGITAGVVFSVGACYGLYHYAKLIVNVK